MIDAHALTFAAEGHFERTQVFGPDPIARILFELGVDVEEFTALAQTIIDVRGREHRGVRESKVYTGALLDGFIIGVRAAREAARVEELARG